MAPSLPLRLYETACVFNKHSIFFYMHINIRAMLNITQKIIDYKMGLLLGSASKLAVGPLQPSRKFRQRCDLLRRIYEEEENLLV